jgi:hypothetical protein
MKVHMFEWVGGLCKLPRSKTPMRWTPPSWWVNGGEADITPDQLKELYDSGINIMIKHSSDRDDNPYTLLAVDDMRFNQR